MSGGRYTINEFDGRRFVAARFNVPRRTSRRSLLQRAARPPRRLVGRNGERVVSIPAHSRDRGSGTRPARRPLCGRSPGAQRRPVSAVRGPRGDIWLIAQLPDHVRLVRWHRATDDFRSYGAAEGLAASRRATGRVTAVDRRGSPGQLFFGFREAGLFAYRDGRFEPSSNMAARSGSARFTSIAGAALGHRDRWRRETHRQPVDAPPGERRESRAQPARRQRPVHGRGRAGPVLLRHDERHHRGRSGDRDTWRYTRAEGLAQNEVWSALASRRGDIWFGTIAGVSRLDPTRCAHDARPADLDHEPST